MTVLVTGATGFVGAHTVRALLDDGQDVRLVVRRPEQVATSMTLVGVDPARVEYQVVDITDRGAMTDAARGCGTVVHAAAVYSWDARRAEDMTRTNVAATEAVVRGGLDAGAGLVVHVSSTVALSRRGGGVVDRDAGPGDLPGSYTRSKVESDMGVRALQAAGAPVVRVHPCAQIGPFDPYLNASNLMVRDILCSLYPMWPTGSLPWGDVRDTAATIAAVVAGRGDGHPAWITPCHNLGDAELIGALRTVTGRRLVTAVLPGSVMVPVVTAARPLIRVLPDGIRLPLPQEGSMELVRSGTRFDDEATVSLLGVGRRSLVDSLRDTVRWMVDSGHLSARRAGRAAA